MVMRIKIAAPVHRTLFRLTLLRPLRSWTDRVNSSGLRLVRLSAGTAGIAGLAGLAWLLPGWTGWKKCFKKADGQLSPDGLGRLRDSLPFFFV